MATYNPTVQQYQQFQGAPPEIEQGAMDLFQRQQLAQMLMQRGLDPAGDTQYTHSGGGQWAAPPQAIKQGWGQGLAKLGQVAAGAYMNKQAGEEQKALAQKLRGSQMDESNQIMDAMQGKAAQPMGPPDESGQMDTTDATSPNMALARSLMMKSYNPTWNDLGKHQITAQADQANTLDMMQKIQAQQPQQPAQLPPATEVTGNESNLPASGGFTGNINDLTQAVAQIADPKERAAALAQLQGQAQAAQPPAPEKVLMGIPRSQAAAMELSGNKVLMAQGKQVMDAYKAMDLENLVKNPNRVVAATQAQAATAANIDKTEAGKDRRATKITSWGDVSKAGQDYFDALPPDKQTSVNMLTSYELDPKSFSTRSGDRAAAMAAAKMVDPNFNPMKYGIRYSVVQDFTKGKTADNIVAIDQAVNHMGTLGELASKLQVGDMQGANYVVNAVSKQFGNPNITNVQLASQAVGEELMRVFRQVGASEREAREWEEKFKASKSPEQMSGAIQTASKLLYGRINALNNRWNNGMDVKTGYPNILSDEARGVLSKYGVTNSENTATPSPQVSSGALTPAEQAELAALKARFRK